MDYELWIMDSSFSRTNIYFSWTGKTIFSTSICTRYFVIFKRFFSLYYDSVVYTVHEIYCCRCQQLLICLRIIKTSHGACIHETPISCSILDTITLPPVYRRFVVWYSSDHFLYSYTALWVHPRVRVESRDEVSHRYRNIPPGSPWRCVCNCARTFRGFSHRTRRVPWWSNFPCASRGVHRYNNYSSQNISDRQLIHPCTGYRSLPNTSTIGVCIH